MIIGVQRYCILMVNNIIVIHWKNYPMILYRRIRIKKPKKLLHVIVVQRKYFFFLNYIITG
ncbi:hypothetical protein BLA29_012966 [Euroglyphus maynei]|uniref:Uncharacterized protein n=1 Tax=Euroglyphus maynei TaxID=6958 RepID=A0A1Y3BES6_EURMA|nr:hypothetical protein BLA29_012966 [Euroglyphus maynei]